MKLDSAIFAPVASTAVTGPGRQARLRDAALAGPGGVGGIVWEPGEREGLWNALIGGGALDQALVEAGGCGRRVRALPGPRVLALVLALVLYGGENYETVLAKMIPHLPGGNVPPHQVPTASALSQARARLGVEPVKALFARHAAPGPPAPGTHYGELLLTGFDGTCVHLAGDPRLREAFGTAPGSMMPQARLVTLVTLGDRRIHAGAIGPYATAEQDLADRLEHALGPGTLNLADRNFYSMRRFLAFHATGTHLLWRIKNANHLVSGRTTARLPDGSYLVRLRESDGMLAERRRQPGQRRAQRLPTTTARLIEFDIHVGAHHTRPRTSRVRLLTTLLDHQAHPAHTLATLYAERWQVEITYLRLKTQLQGNRTPLRARSPALAEQELWALMTVYNILCTLAADAAALHGIDPDQISFITVLRHTRAHLAADLPCPACGHHQDQPKHVLTRAIAASPRNRTSRKRTSPRTPTERKTGRTRNATYTITITESNLPKEHQPTLT